MKTMVKQAAAIVGLSVLLALAYNTVQPAGIAFWSKGSSPRPVVTLPPGSGSAPAVQAGAPANPTGSVPPVSGNPAATPAASVGQIPGQVSSITPARPKTEMTPPAGSAIKPTPPAAAGPTGPGQAPSLSLPTAPVTPPASNAGEAAPTVSLAEAKRLYDTGAVFVDARPPEAFALGRVPFAINVPDKEFEQFFPQLAAVGVPLAKLVIVYCDGQECHASLNVAEKLRAKGFRNVRVFFGGWQQWTAATYPMEW